MQATILKGKPVAAHTLENVRQAVEQRIQKGVRPGLAVVLIGDDAASHVYVRNKEATCTACGMYSAGYRLPAETSQEALLQLIAQLNADDNIHGILVQKPLPPHMDEAVVNEAIAPQKDVDGFHPYNQGRLWTGGEGFIPCTPAGIMQMLDTYRISIAGKHAVVIGRSNIVGKPIAALLLQAHATVTICHSQTAHIAEITRQADIVIAAIGQPQRIDATWIKEGAVVVDVGINRLPNGKLCGDVAYEDVLPRVQAITPVPGGVGPMTIAMLMQNTCIAAQRFR